MKKDIIICDEIIPDSKECNSSKEYFEKLKVASSTFHFFTSIRSTTHFYTKDKEGTVLHEFWNKNKKLAIYLEKDGSKNFLKSWGPSMTDEMEDGEIKTIEKMIDLFVWIIEGNND